MQYEKLVIWLVYDLAVVLSPSGSIWLRNFVTRVIATLYKTVSSADGIPILIICTNISRSLNLSGFCFAFIFVPETIISIARLTILEITVAIATPFTPHLNTIRNIALSIRLSTFPMAEATRLCFVWPNALKYPEKTGMSAFSTANPPTIFK